MLAPRAMLACLALVVLVALAGPGLALGASAGDNQYVDPLSSTHTTTTSAPASPPPASSSAPASSSGAQTSASSSATTTTSTSTASPTTGKTLPFTGFDALPVAIVGLVLLGGGLVLRRGLASS